MAFVAGVDVGGTNITAGLVDDDLRVVDEHEVTTPDGGPDTVVEAIAKAVGKLDEEPEAIGLGAPGPVNQGVLQSAPNLVGFSAPTPLAEMVAEATGLPVVLGNDATLGTLGEAVAGAGRGVSTVLGIWAGTGVGGGLVVDGRPFGGAFGGAGEFGHLIVRAGGALCGCGRRGCVEAYAGRRSLEHEVAIAVEAGHETSLYEIMEDAGKDRLTSKVWKQALADGDPLATRLIDEAIDAIGIGLGSALNLLDVGAVVIGGGLAEKLGQDFADRIDEASRPWTLTPQGDRRVVVAELGDHSGIVGAAAAARTLADTVRDAAMPG